MAQSNELHAVVISPERTLFSAYVDALIVPGEKGQFEILRNHAPLISSLTTGTIICRGNDPFELHIVGGFIEVKDNEVTLCVEVDNSR